jgi:predicted nucleic acid-binding protein
MFLDTSGLLCYHHRDEPLHAEAVALFQRAPHRLTHNYVLAEFIPLCQVRGLDRSKALEFARDLIESELVEVIWVDRTLHQAALDLLRARADKTYSLCDAVSFVLMRTHGITEALTTDRHFEQEGFTHLLKP